MAEHSILCEWCPALYRISSDLLDREGARFFAFLRGWRLFPDRQWCSDCREKREQWAPPVPHVPKSRRASSRGAR